MEKRIIVYHADCHDGITALWVCRQKWPDAEAYPGVHGEPPDLDRLRDADVVVVDFSWRRDVLLDVEKVAASLVVLDHHQTARDDLAGLAFATFDMERSGAGLAWDTLFPEMARPALVNYVEDRDLWRFALPGCREVHAACNSWPLTIGVRSGLMETSIDSLIRDGAGILRYHDLLVANAASTATRATIRGHNVPVVTCPNLELVSDLGQALAAAESFAAVRVPGPDGRHKVSLRSAPDGADVGAIAKSLGGGGHRHAASYPGDAEFHADGDPWLPLGEMPTKRGHYWRHLPGTGAVVLTEYLPGDTRWSADWLISREPTTGPPAPPPPALPPPPAKGGE
jgi:uncharacterized protein